MQSYFISTIYSITFLAILDVFISRTNNGKTVQVIISLISVVILAVPIVNVIKNYTFNGIETESNYEYSKYLVQFEKKLLSNKVESLLKRENIEFDDVRYDYIEDENGITLKKITIKTKNDVLNGSSEHIDMTERAILALKNIIDTGVCEIRVETD